jgi:hypothetical protein
MEKIPTLFVRNPENMKLVTREVTHDAMWVLAGEGNPTRKMDGINIRVNTSNGYCLHVEKRRNPTREEKANGVEPGYIGASRDNSADKHIFAAVDATTFADWPDGAWPCEALGPKIQGGCEVLTPMLYPFTLRPYPLTANPRTYDEIRDFLERSKIEGIVWHHPDGRMAKIKRRDFGLSWPVK